MDRPNAEGAAGSPADHDAAGAANKRLRIVTRCGSLEEFFATFGPFAGDSSLFIVTNKPRSLGLRQPFVIQLREGETIMRGDVEVVESIVDGTGPEGRNGMRLKLLQADPATLDVHRRLLAHAKARRASAASAAEVAPASVAAASEARPPLATPDSPPKPARPASAPSRAEGETPVVRAEEKSGLGRPPIDSTNEERVPGSSYQLPANPFEGITAEALESFVECTLYEERLPRGAEADGDTPPPSRSGASLSAAGAPSATPLPIVAPAISLVAASPVVAPSAPTFGPAPAPPPAAGSSAARPAPVREKVLVAAAIQAASVPAVAPLRKPWVAGLLATAVISSVASLGGAYFLWGRQQGAPTSPTGTPGPVTATATATAVVPTAERTATAASAAPTASASASASATSAASPPLLRECKANVRSYPLGATVRWNDEPIGTTPLTEAPVPCGPARVTFELTGFVAGERSAGAVVGKNAGVFLRLAPVLVPVEVTSTPSGASVLVDGRTVGRTPSIISMIGMREATMVLTLPKYKPWTRKVTAEPPKATVHADLEAR